jgi:hypothetical protein
VNTSPSGPGGYFLTCSARAEATKSGTVTQRRERRVATSLPYAARTPGPRVREHTEPQASPGEGV